MKFNETSPALTAKQIKVTRMIAQAKRIQARIDEMQLEEMIAQQGREAIEKQSGLS